MLQRTPTSLVVADAMVLWPPVFLDCEQMFYFFWPYWVNCLNKMGSLSFEKKTPALCGNSDHRLHGCSGCPMTLIAVWMSQPARKVFFARRWTMGKPTVHSGKYKLYSIVNVKMDGNGSSSRIRCLKLRTQAKKHKPSDIECVNPAWGYWLILA